MISKIAYYFHMPLFCIISGYVTNPHKDRAAQLSWIRQTLIIYLLAQSVNILLNLMLGNNISWNVIINPKFALWYLVSLIIWRIILWGLFKNFTSSTQIILSVLLMLVMGFIPLDKEFSFQRTFAFFPFFIIGQLFRKKDTIKQMDKISIVFPLVSVTIGLVVARFVIPWFYAPAQHFNGISDLIIRVILTLFAFYMSISILCLSRKVNLPKSLASFGKYTMWIYIGHTYFVIIISHYCQTHNILFNLLEAISITLFICILFCLMGLLWHKIT